MQYGGRRDLPLCGANLQALIPNGRAAEPLRQEIDEQANAERNEFAGRHDSGDQRVLHDKARQDLTQPAAPQVVAHDERAGEDDPKSLPCCLREDRHVVGGERPTDADGLRAIALVAPHVGSLGAQTLRGIADLDTLNCPDLQMALARGTDLQAQAGAARQFIPESEIVRLPPIP